MGIQYLFHTLRLGGLAGLGRRLVRLLRDGVGSLVGGLLSIAGDLRSGLRSGIVRVRGGLRDGTPRMGEACGEWFRDIVRVAFGSWDPEARIRFIRDILAMLPKGQSKTTYSSGLLMTGMLMNRRPRAEALFVAPTQAIADNAYEKAVGMVECSPDLKRRFRPRDHVKTIEDLAGCARAAPT